MMAEAFALVHFPIRPVLHQDDEGKLRMYRRNSNLITPPDFDYSPYFDVIKYPLLDLDDLAVYKKLPWDRSGVHCNAVGDCYVSDPNEIERIEPAEVKTEEIKSEDDDSWHNKASMNSKI